MKREINDNFEYAKLPFSHILIYILYSSRHNRKAKMYCAFWWRNPITARLRSICCMAIFTVKMTFFQFTSIGWMMWHWSVSVLGTGATLVLFDGSPLKPDPCCLWKRLSELKVTHFGTSARYLISLQETNFKLPDNISAESLIVIFSTGSPLPKSTFEYVYRNLKFGGCTLASITGGTDIISLFCGRESNPSQFMLERSNAFVWEWPYKRCAQNQI